jgi:hypothetical protein
MYNGYIVVDVFGEEKRNLTVAQLLNLFSQTSGSDAVDDKLVLSGHKRMTKGSGHFEFCRDRYTRAFSGQSITMQQASSRGLLHIR